jgi:hypothetical protein
MDEERRRNLSPGLRNSLEGDEMMTVGPLLLCLGLGAVILVIIVVALL